MRRTFKRLAAGIPATVLAAAGCGEDEAVSGTTTTTAAATTAAATTATTTTATTASGAPATTATEATTTEATTTEAPRPTLRLDLVGFSELRGGFHYEAWLVVEGAPVSAGTFNVSADGSILSLDGRPTDGFPITEETATASAIVETIEPPGDPDPAPADTRLVAGDLVGGTGDLTVGHPEALGTDFADAAGEFVLATPSTDTRSDELSGIWFLALPGPEPGLTLPELPAGWRYEGWAVVDGRPFTGGTFTDPAARDDAAPYSGPGRIPGFPGEDYVANAPDGVTFPTDLSGQTVMVSVEPDPDDDPGPFVLRPLAGMIPVPAQPEPVAYDLARSVEDLPSGTATIV